MLMSSHFYPFLGSWHQIDITLPSAGDQRDPGLRCNAHLLHDPQQLPHIRGRIQAAETTPLQDAESDLEKNETYMARLTWTHVPRWLTWFYLVPEKIGVSLEDW